MSNVNTIQMPKNTPDSSYSATRAGCEREGLDLSYHQMLCVLCSLAGSGEGPMKERKVACAAVSGALHLY